jgi:hypothetical protein
MTMDIKTFDINERYSKHTSSSTLYGYLGPLTQTELDKVLLRTEKILSKSLSSRLAIKKIYNILFESVQNVYSYLKHKTEQEKLLNTYILVNKIGGKYAIITGNFMLKEDMRSIQSRIEIVNVMTKEELKDLYRGVLEIGGTSEHGGAGLGFIDMAKRASGDLEYEFVEVDENYVFFVLETAVTVEN